MRVRGGQALEKGREFFGHHLKVAGKSRFAGHGDSSYKAIMNRNVAMIGGAVIFFAIMVAASVGLKTANAWLETTYGEHATWMGLAILLLACFCYGFWYDYRKARRRVIDLESELEALRDSKPRRPDRTGS